MKIAVVSDPHLGSHSQYGGEWKAGLNDRGRMTIDVFRRAIQTSRTAGAELFIVAGDLFHTRRPEPAEIVAVQRVLAEEAVDLGVILVPGNHDMLEATAEEGNTACETLWREATVIRKPEPIEGVFCVPFDAATPMRTYLESVTPKGPDLHRAKILVTHVGVYDDKSPSWCRNAADGIHKDALFDLMDRADFDLAFVGNYHNPAVWESARGRTIVQVGTLCPASFSDAGLKDRGRVALYDPKDGLQFIEIPGPRFYVAKDGQELPMPDGQNSYYVRHQRSEPTLNEVVQMTKLFTHYEHVEPERQLVDKERPVGVEDARGALIEFVKTMQLPDGVDRQVVLTQVTEIWRTVA